MNQLEFQIQKGYELDKENSTDETIIYKKKENKYPLSVNEIEGRDFYINDRGQILCSDGDCTINQSSTKKRAKSFLALMQLVELRDAWNKTDGFEVDWRDEHQEKYIIENIKQEITVFTNIGSCRTLYFGSPKTRDLFLKTFRDLIETAKELL